MGRDPVMTESKYTSEPAFLGLIKVFTAVFRPNQIVRHLLKCFHVINVNEPQAQTECMAQLQSLENSLQWQSVSLSIFVVAQWYMVKVLMRNF